jgi:S1-C subfamily serine protease
MSPQDQENKLVVNRLSPGGPAQRAGIKSGDMVLKVGATRVTGLAELYRAVWRLGPAGVDVPLTIARGGDVLNIIVKSADRADFLKKPNLH